MSETRTLKLTKLQSLAYDQAMQFSKASGSEVGNLQKQIQKLEEEVARISGLASDQVSEVMLSILKEHDLDGFPFSPCSVEATRESGKVVCLVFTEPAKEEPGESRQP